MVHVQSGGSTGVPKQLSRPIETWVTSAQLEAQAFGLSAQDRFAVLGSPSHSLWGYAHFRAAQLAAPCVGLSASDIFARSASALQKWSAVAPTALYGVPELVTTFARQLQRHAQPALSVRMVLLGGGPVSPSFPTSLMQSVFPNASLLSFYGTAETSFIGYARLEAPPFVLFPSVELDIRGEAESSEIGEIWVRSPMTITPQEWVSTGDLGRWADGGRFHLLGRAARQLVVKGEKHLVEPIEQALMQRFDLARVALLANSEGRVCCLVARCSGEAGAGGSVPVLGPSPEQVNAACRDHDPSFPGVRRVITLPAKEWPITPAGKTNFVALREILEGANT
ncbi:CaiC Acyl-CoA synthetases (AMP-forming)/AMP-acid ligases II [Burkholderiales bacterium]